ncbi:MAG: 50S ribosomal protein L32 [Pseudomonadota bacterium]
MAVPKRKVSPHRRGNRRAHDALKAEPYHECPTCGEMKRPHNVCHSCGYYNGRKVLDIKGDTYPANR